MNPGPPALSIVVPAHNEAERIGPTLDALAARCPEWPWTVEIVVVDDGSTDETTAVVLARRHRLPGLRLVSHPVNRGKGAAVRSGMLAARGHWRAFIDADGATPVEELPALLRAAEDRPGTVAIGSIACPGAVVEERQSWSRVVASRVGRRIIRSLALPGVADSQRGCKLFPGPLCEVVFGRSTISGWGFDIEVLALARALGAEIVEVPVRWRHQPGGSLRPSDYLSTLRDVGRVRRNLADDAYGLGTGRVPRRRPRSRLAPVRQPG